MVSVAVTEIMEIWAASRLVNGPTSVLYWRGCEREGKFNVAIRHIFFSETFETSMKTKLEGTTILYLHSYFLF